MRTFLLVAALVSSMAGAARAQRLPATVTPAHYTLWFAPDLQNATFRGRETIDVVVTTPTTTVTLNAAEIQFETVTIRSGGATQSARVSLDGTNELVTFTVDRPLARGAASIDIAYTGILNDKLRGFYLGSEVGAVYKSGARPLPAPGRRAGTASFRESAGA